MADPQVQRPDRSKFALRIAALGAFAMNATASMIAAMFTVDLIRRPLVSLAIAFAPLPASFGVVFLAYPVTRHTH